MSRTMRLSGGELLVDAAAVPALRAALELLLQHRRDLWTVRDPDDRARRDQLRALVAAAWADPSASPSPEVAEGPRPASSDHRLIATVHEAATMLQVSDERVRQMLAAGQLAGAQDRRGGPWRIDRDDLDRLATDRKATT